MEDFSAMSEWVDIKTRDGTFAYQLQKIDGLYMLAQIKKLGERLQQIREIQYKDGDVMIATYPKVGCHWLEHSVQMLMLGKPELVHELDNNLMELRTSLEDINNISGPRLLKMSLYSRHLSEESRGNLKFILGLRNPKDTAVSFFYHYQRDPLEKFAVPWADFIELFSQGRVPWGSFFTWYRQWQEFMTSHPDQVLPVYYEDMQKDYKKQLRRIADFLGYNVSDDLLQQIKEKMPIKNVLNELMKDEKIQEYAKKVSKDGILPFYRKGIVGDWKNHFTVAQNENFDKLIESEMKESIFTFEYTI